MSAVGTMAGQYDAGAAGKMERYLEHERISARVNSLGGINDVARGGERQTGLMMIANRLEAITNRIERMNNLAGTLLDNLGGQWEAAADRDPNTPGDARPMLGRLEQIADRLTRAADRQEMIVAQLEKI